MSWFSMPTVDSFDGEDGPIGVDWATMGTTDGPPVQADGFMVFGEADFLGAYRTETYGPDVRIGFRAATTFDSGSPYCRFWLRATGLGTSSRSGYCVAIFPEDGPTPTQLKLERVDDEVITTLETLDDFIDENEPPLTIDASIGGQVIGTLLQAWIAGVPGDPVRFQKVLEYDFAEDIVKYETAGQVGIEMFVVSGWSWTNFRAETELEGSTGEPIPQTPNFLMATGEGWQSRPMWRPVDGIWIPPEV